MMRPSADVQVYLHREPIDMRRGRNGLAALLPQGMHQDPLVAQAMYVFVGRRYDSLKILGCDRCRLGRGGRRRSQACCELEAESRFH